MANVPTQLKRTFLRNMDPHLLGSSKWYDGSGQTKGTVDVFSKFMNHVIAAVGHAASEVGLSFERA